MHENSSLRSNAGRDGADLPTLSGSVSDAKESGRLIQIRDNTADTMCWTQGLWFIHK